MAISLWLRGVTPPQASGRGGHTGRRDFSHQLRYRAHHPNELTVKCYQFYWRALLPTTAFIAGLVLSASHACGQGAFLGKTQDEKPPPLPSKKASDEDPPLPSKKPVPGKEIRVQVTAASAEVQAGDKVIATVSRGQVLPFTKKTDDYYLVNVNGQKGWIKREEVREIEVAVAGPNAPMIDVPAGPAPAVIDKDTTRKVKQATAYLRVRLANGNTVEGSGFFAVQPDLVLTNAHVLGMLRPGSPIPADVQVVVHSGEAEEFTLPAQVLGVDRENDLGVVRVKGGAGRLPAPLAVGTSRTLALVQKVYIFGFPFGTSLGKDITASESSISSIRKDATGATTDVQVNGGMHPGNSGGPVVDSWGVVVGVAGSMIRGTQINLAVPGEKVQELLRGRVDRTELGEAFLDKDQAKVPVRLNCLDPLHRIRTVKLEVWAGNASPARPASTTEPKPLPGEGARQSVALTYQNAGAQVDVTIPSLAAGQVLWIQPVLTDAAGATHWAGAVAYNRSDLPPLERKAVLLEASAARQAQRTLKLTGSLTVQFSKGAKQMLLEDSMEVQLLETAQKEPRGGRLDLFLGAYKFMTTEMNGKPRPLFPEAQRFLRDRNMTFIVDPQGKLLQRTVPVLNPPHPIILREDFAELVHQIANSYEMTCLAVPNRRVEPQETWEARVPLILAGQNKKEIVDIFLTCTYEGSRVHGEQKCAVITLSGTIKGRKPGQQSAVGVVTGKAHFAIDDGYLSLANLKVESESADADMTLTHSLQVFLTRVRGNTAGIVAGPVAPVPGAPVAKGKAIFQGDLKLTADDPVNCPGKPGCFCKVQAINLVAGKTYIIEMDKVDQSNLDPYLVLVNPGGQVVAQDDDSGGFPNARIIYRAPEAGMFRVYATSFAPRMTGVFRLTVSEEAGANSADYELAAQLLKKRDFDQAVPLLEKAVAANPTLASAHNDLGFAYNEKGFYDKAIPCLKKAVELDPKRVSALNNLGVAYNAQGLYDQGIPCLKKAVELQPKHTIALDNLGTALGEVGDWKEACDVLTKAQALTPETARQFEVRARNLEQMETLLRLEPRLAEIMKRELKPKDFQEAMQFGKLCRLKKHYRAAIELYEEALASDPDAAKKLAPVNLVIQARVAVLASTGRGNDPPPEAGRPEYRAKALACLQKFIKTQQEALASNFSANRYSCQASVRVLLLHQDLAAVRAPALNNVPADARHAWENLWNEVGTLLAKAEAPLSDASGQR